MSRILLLVPERSAGWISNNIIPLMREMESGVYAALTGAGQLVEVVGLNHFLKNRRGMEYFPVVLVQPKGIELRAVEERLQGTGVWSLSVGDGDRSGRHVIFPIGRTISGTSIPFSLKLSRLPHYSSTRGWRGIFQAPNLTDLRPASGEEVVARWGDRGKVAVIRRKGNRTCCWRLGFPLHYLDPTGLARLLQIIDENEVSPAGFSAPLPSGQASVVLLLHDVEDALPGDPRGIRSVRDGLEACLEAQARYGIKATYNLVGTFAEKIPDLVCRIATEGHEISSHGGTHSVMAELVSADLQADVVEAESRIATVCGVKVRGFRSPRTRWSTELLELLETRGYLWNAEADSSSFPYHVPLNRPSSLVRIPVAVDDWDYVRHRASPDQISRLWKRQVRSAIRRGCWVAIGSHPSVLGTDRGRMKAFRNFVSWLAQENVAVMTHGSAAEWWNARAEGKGPESTAAGKSIERA